mmetsp:Transcript_5714/g.10270  ORF Transcript_5714/g.10270 Transcript_5714/m.10270 type:complete len:295 (-) Transcript_5714:638-1522(-)
MPGRQHALRHERSVDAPPGNQPVCQRRLAALLGERLELAGHVRHWPLPCVLLCFFGLVLSVFGGKTWIPRATASVGAICLHGVLDGSVQHAASRLKVWSHREDDHQHRQRHQVPHFPSGLPLRGCHLQLHRGFPDGGAGLEGLPHPAGGPLEYLAARVCDAVGKCRPGDVREGGVRHFLPDHVPGLRLHADHPAAQPGHRHDGGELREGAAGGAEGADRGPRGAAHPSRAQSGRGDDEETRIPAALPSGINPKVGADSYLRSSHVWQRFGVGGGRGYGHEHAFGQDEGTVRGAD